MNLGHRLFFIVFLTIIMVTTVEAQAQPMLSFPADSSSTTIASSENNVVKILGLDFSAFPKIKVNLFIDKFCAMVGNLKKENFKVKENNTNVAIDNFYFTGNTSGQKLDLAVVFDDTGSMGEEISAMKSKVRGLTDQLDGSGIDTKYALVTFKDRYSVKTNWTSDPAVFRSSVNSLQEKGGDDEPEVSLDAIEAVLTMGFRTDAQKIILVITDAHAHYKNDSSIFSNYTKEEIEKDLKESGAIFIPVSPNFEKSSTYVDLREVANDTQSMWIEINRADFSTILEQLQGILTGTYVIEYTSPNQMPSENRTVLATVNAPGCVEGRASGTYITPDSAWAWLLKGNALFLHGNYGESIPCYDKAIELDPNLALAWSNKGTSLNQLGKYGEALEVVDKAIELDPNLSSAWNSKGYALNSLGRYNESLQACDKAIELNPDLADAWAIKGYALNSLGRYDEGLQACDEAIQLNPDYAEAWANKGWALNSLGRYDEALQACDKAIKLNPDLADAWANKGQALNAQGKYDEAIECFDEAVRLDPNDIDAWNNMSVALEALGRNTEASTAFAKAKELGYEG
ncbi:MAG TPA: tetratricopeptide repeat protein [Methanothrix sp.]|nr:tetratricopeptide repeat protein [Methanothrix sp.]